MADNNKRSFSESSAKVISVIFHPLFMPVWGLAIILSHATPYGYLPVDVKKILFLILIVNNVFIPVTLIPLFKHMNYISSWNISDRKERVGPLIATAFLYATTCYIIFRFPVPFFLKSFIFSTFLISVLVTGFNLIWRISLHAVGAGAILAVILLLSMRMYFPLSWQVIALITVGSILSARLILNEHSPLEVWSGFATGFAGLMFFMIVIQKFI